MIETVRRFAYEAPVLTWFVILWVAAEAGAALIVPAVLSPVAYLGGYQPERADRSVEALYDGAIDARLTPIAAASKPRAVRR